MDIERAAPGAELGLPSEGPGSLATFSQRTIARLIDLTVGLGLAVIIFSILSLTRDGGIGDLAIPIVSAAIAVLAYGVYEVAGTALRGQTLGKAAAGIRVARPDGSAPGWGKSAIRWALPAVLAMIPVAASPLVLVPYLMALGDRNRRGLHDKAAGTVVVTVR